MLSYRSSCFWVAVLLVAAVTVAGEPPGKPFNISTPQSFHEQAAQARAGMQPGGIYAFLSTQDRRRVGQRIAGMDAVFKRYGNIQAMSGAERVDLFNAQESVNQILTRGRTGNIRCAWAPQTGTHISRTACWNTGR